ncbi:hypothetical protein L596_008898 [Steinernema carpocapsae]|uniref:Uncharacterized protein n=1 Tax=Steinernema carpocapsae TaxID=34508 RepID=A0A4U5PE47_STECR|nr:hypothetical protein L596_008898 [Steinernema carpocapsae]
MWLWNHHRRSDQHRSEALQLPLRSRQPNFGRRWMHVDTGPQAYPLPYPPRPQRPLWNPQHARSPSLQPASGHAPRPQRNHRRVLLTSRGTHLGGPGIQSLWMQDAQLSSGSSVLLPLELEALLSPVNPFTSTSPTLSRLTDSGFA